MEGRRMLQQLHPPYPMREDLVLRRGRGGSAPFRQSSCNDGGGVLRDILPEFGPPSSIEGVVDNINGVPQHQHNPTEMQNYRNNMDPSSHGVPFESHQYHMQQQQGPAPMPLMPMHNLPPPSRFHHHNNQYSRRFSGHCVRPPRFSRPWHHQQQRRHYYSHQQNVGFRSPPPPLMPNNYFYGPPPPPNINNSPPHPPPFNYRFPGDLENNHEMPRQISNHRRHSDPVFYDRRGGVERQRSPPQLLPLMMSPPPQNGYANKTSSAEEYFNNDEEYVPVPVERGFSRVRRIRLASLETIPDSNSSSNNSLPDEEVDQQQQNKDCEEEEESEEPAENVEEDVFAESSSLILSPSSSPASLSSSEDVDITQHGIATAYIASLTKYVLIGKQKTELRASFGIWMGDENCLNFGGLVPLMRPQCHKNALIYAGAECLNSLKGKGFTQINIIESEDYMVKNICTWLNKAKVENDFVLSEVSNWDEYKYTEEIGQLCRSCDGMKINWVHITGKCDAMEQAVHLARESLPKDYIVENPDADKDIP